MTRRELWRTFSYHLGDPLADGYILAVEHAGMDRELVETVVQLAVEGAKTYGDLSIMNVRRALDVMGLDAGNALYAYDILRMFDATAPLSRVEQDELRRRGMSAAWSSQLRSKAIELLWLLDSGGQEFVLESLRQQPEAVRHAFTRASLRDRHDRR